jgi:hypothetical protein
MFGSRHRLLPSPSPLSCHPERSEGSAFLPCFSLSFRHRHSLPLPLTSVDSVSSDPGEVLKSPNCQAAHHRQPDPEASRVAHLFAFSPFNFGLSTLLLSGVHISIILWDLLWDLRFLCFHTLTHSFASCDPAAPFHSIPSALFGKNTRAGYTLFKPRPRLLRGNRSFVTSLPPASLPRFSSHGTNAPLTRLHRCGGKIHA